MAPGRAEPVVPLLRDRRSGRAGEDFRVRGALRGELADLGSLPLPPEGEEVALRSSDGWGRGRELFADPAFCLCPPGWK
ncbi:hypothetical protein MPLSOD_130057 [Mesorhizobium sp. SOD10]|nr:hypothetical protein MPLSOD_130057 [Mesorhizobium sp. SOD10]